MQNELVAAYNELRDELATEKFGVKYSELSDEQQKAVREIYPQRISEANSSLKMCIRDSLYPLYIPLTCNPL